ncbi:hypothetical protein AB1E18_018713 [Capra hircus]
MRSSRAGILGAPHPARSPGRPPAPPLGLAPPSGAEPAARGTPGAGEPHSDTGGRPGRRRTPGPPRRVPRRLLRESGRQGAPVLQPARSQPSASTVCERPIRAQRGGRAAGLASLPPPAARRRRRCPRESNSSELRRREPGAGDARGVRGGCCPTRRGGNPVSPQKIRGTARRPCRFTFPSGRRETEDPVGDPGKQGPRAGGDSRRALAGRRVRCVKPRRTGWASGRVAPPTNTQWWFLNRPCVRSVIPEKRNLAHQMRRKNALERDEEVEASGGIIFVFCNLGQSSFPCISAMKDNKPQRT